MKRNGRAAMGVTCVVAVLAGCGDSDGGAAGGGATSTSSSSSGAGGADVTDDICAWLADPESCYRTIARDAGAKCGALGTGTSAEGTFALRESLDTCILQTQNGAAYQGGQVTFSPPLDLAAAPGTTSQNITLLRNDGTTCGRATVGPNVDFSIEIFGSGEIEGGRYTQHAQSYGLEALCLDDGSSTARDTFVFDASAECPGYDQLRPRAELEVEPGSVGINGVVRLRVYFPPPEGELEGRDPYAVEYFQCIIPAPPGPCDDELQNGTETDIDCGGAVCPDKCDDGQKCASDTDCVAGLTCQVIEGLLKCRE